MQQINNDQYFLLIPDINLCPQIKADTISMLEQVFNACILINKNNIQQGINNILELEYYCKAYLLHNYITVLEQITPLLNKFSMYVAQGEQVRLMYPKYHKQQKFYWDVGKQSAINLEFALEKKLSFDGVDIKWEQTFIDMVDKLMLEQAEQSQYNNQDELIYYSISPKVMDKRLDVHDIILEETQKYVNTYRQKLQLERASIL